MKKQALIPMSSGTHILDFLASISTGNNRLFGCNLLYEDKYGGLKSEKPILDNGAIGL